MLIIPYKEKPSEFEIQAYLYIEIKKLGFNIRGNVPNSRKRVRGYERRMIFDLVIFDKENKPQIIIEVKDSNRHSEATLQCKKYLTTGYPVDYVKGMENALKYVKTLKIKGNANDYL